MSEGTVWLISDDGANVYEAINAMSFPQVMLFPSSNYGYRYPTLYEYRDSIVKGAVRMATEQMFVGPATHDFPSTVQIAVEWHPEVEVLAKELGYSTTSAAEVASRFEVFVGLPAKAQERCGSHAHRPIAEWKSEEVR